MDKLAFSDYVTIGVVVAVVLIAYHWYRDKNKKGCGCPPKMAADAPKLVAPAGRPGVKSCAA